MSEQASKYLTMARNARKENNVEDAKRYYDMVRTDDPENVEAKFFYAYYRCWSGTKGSAYQDFMTFCNSCNSIVKQIAASKEIDQKSLLVEIFEAIQGMPTAMSEIQKDLWKSAPDSEKSKYNDQKKSCEKMGILLIYNFGDSVFSEFENNKAIVNIAVEAWKKAVAVNQQYPYCGVEKSYAEKYAEKIKKFDPDYSLPKKAGCISFA